MFECSDVELQILEHIGLGQEKYGLRVHISKHGHMRIYPRRADGSFILIFMTSGVIYIHSHDGTEQFNLSDPNVFDAINSIIHMHYGEKYEHQDI